MTLTSRRTAALDGMVLAAVNLLERKPHATETEIRAGLSGNLCRCTGYTKIFAAVMAACRDMDRTVEG